MVVVTVTALKTVTGEQALDDSSQTQCFPEALRKT